MQQSSSFIGNIYGNYSLTCTFILCMCQLISAVLLERVSDVVCDDNYLLLPYPILFYDTCVKSLKVF